MMTKEKVLEFLKYMKEQNNNKKNICAGIRCYECPFQGYEICPNDTNSKEEYED